jgi:hypothetical protein
LERDGIDGSLGILGLLTISLILLVFVRASPLRESLVGMPNVPESERMVRERQSLFTDRLYFKI